MMKAMRLQQPAAIDKRPLQYTDVATPEPGPHQLLLQVEACGVCHTDLHTVEGDLDLPRLPIIPGHQVVGTVVACGTAVTNHQPGDRVGVGWLYQTCGRCRYCQQGQENLCPEAKFTGLHVDGGYSHFMVVDAAFAYPLPSRFTNVEAAPLLCAGIIGFRSLRLSGIRPKGKLGLYGFGASAHLAIQIARHWECEVYVFTRSEAHRRHARALGAVWAGGAEDQPAALLDASVTFAPAGWIVPLALGHLRPGGTLAINAIHMSPIPQLDYQLLYGERTIRSVANFTRQDAHDFLQLASEIPIQTTTVTFPLQEVNEALLALKASQLSGAAVLIAP